MSRASHVTHRCGQTADGWLCGLSRELRRQPLFRWGAVSRRASLCCRCGAPEAATLPTIVGVDRVCVFFVFGGEQGHLPSVCVLKVRRHPDEHVSPSGSEAAKQQRPPVADAEEKKSQISADSGLSVMSGSQVCCLAVFPLRLLVKNYNCSFHTCRL